MTLNLKRGTRRRAFLVGVGSLIDLSGLATYRAMQDLLPSPDLRPMADLYRDTDRLMASTPTSLSKLRSSSPR